MFSWTTGIFPEERLAQLQTQPQGLSCEWAKEKKIIKRNAQWKQNTGKATSQLPASFLAPSARAIWLMSYLSKAQRATLPLLFFLHSTFLRNWDCLLRTHTYCVYILKELEVLIRTTVTHWLKSIGRVAEYMEINKKLTCPKSSVLPTDFKDLCQKKVQIIFLWVY